MLISLRNPNYNSSEDISVRSHWGLIQVPLSVRDIPQLVCARSKIILRVCECVSTFRPYLKASACFGVFQRQAYLELNLSSGQLGIDDHAHIHPGIYTR